MSDWPYTTEQKSLMTPALSGKKTKRARILLPRMEEKTYPQYERQEHVKPMAPRRVGGRQNAGPTARQGGANGGFRRPQTS